MLTHTNTVNIASWQRDAINKLKKKYDKEDNFELYCETLANVDGRSKSKALNHDQKAENRLNLTSPSSQINQCISSISEGLSGKFETQNTKQYDDNGNHSCTYKNISVGSSSMKDTVSREHVQSAISLAPSDTNIKKDKMKINFSVGTVSGEPKMESKQGMGKDSLDIENGAEVVLGGAVWDIFRRHDVPKLIEYLRKHKKEFRHLQSKPIDSVSSIAKPLFSLLTICGELCLF